MIALPVAEIPFRRVLGLNQQTYQRLKLALGLQLRRQVFVAVCDDLVLRDRLAAQLQTDLAAGEPPMRLVTLRLNATQANPIAQMSDWIEQAREQPTFQIVGVEQLTRQPAAVQRQFLTNLQTFDRTFGHLDCNLLLWMPQPWFRSIRQSAPGFWQIHTGVFEFVGDPTPLQPIVEPLRPIAERSQPDLDTPESNLDAEAMLVPAAMPNRQQLEEFPAAAALIPTEDRSSKIAILPAKKGRLIEDPIAQPLLDRIEQLHQQQAAAETLAEAYRALANLYRDRIDQGDASDTTWQRAIEAYEQVLVWLPETASQWADVLNDLGNLHWGRSRHSDPVPHLQQAIELYELALYKTEQPQILGMLQNNLGAAYADLARYENPTEALQNAIAAYQQALQNRSPQSDPQRYASTQNNLGTAHWNLAQHQQPLDNLRGAIAAYSEALHFYRPEQDPLNYAMIQNNLGTAYWNIAQYERPQDWLRLALSSYAQALRYRTATVSPAAFAATQSNLGTACWHLANCTDDPQMQRSYLQRAVAAYEAAIDTAATLDSTLSFDIFATQNNLGLAYHQLAIDPHETTDDRSAQLEQSLHHHLQALQGWQNSPLRQTALDSVLQTMRSIYEQGGIYAQNQAFAKLPANLLPELLPQL
ncbi:tetratricopeptide repeat protein [Microcoleus sp. FACHB-1515]|nr:tetratricopeptide repeat protein [Microcoleus sp. FACHB-1515]MBD2092051.1 tetratricopeptide repeat protein [Microcoleus sp. FACHB-1515]